MPTISHSARSLVLITFLLAACGDDDGPGGGDGDGGPTDSSTPGVDGGVPGTDGGTPGVDAWRAPRPDSGPARSVSCADPRPPDAEPAPELAAYSGGTCPALVAGVNSLMSSGAKRSF